ncbi:MAG: response regulator [Proteobacteria bacterium]|nr:response regulator [Pseudomonadota bacterium]
MNDQVITSTRILFVDDSKVLLKTASKILSAEFDVVTAVDGQDAWVKLGQDHSIQVMFSDISMPNCDGYELLGRVRTSDDAGLNAMPVILVTGADDDETARQTALDRGATDFLNKKYLSSELLPRARAHSKYQRISQQLQAQSKLDPLTGLANEQGFLDRLAQDIAYARRHKLDLALLRLEIDHLPALYEHLGNRVVEPIVLRVAELISGRIRAEDTAAHIGLGGFAISVPGGQLRGVESMAAGLQAKVAAMPVEVGGKRLAVSLTTAVIGGEPSEWTTAPNALAHSAAAIAHHRQQAQAEREHARRLAEEQAARELAHRQAEEQAERERARRHAEDQARRQAEEQAERELARRHAEDQARRQAEEQAAREAASREQARRQAEEQAAREAASREQARRKAEEQAAREVASREQARRQAEEQAERERARRHAEDQARRKADARKSPAAPQRQAQGRMAGVWGGLHAFWQRQRARMARWFRKLSGK